MTGNAVPSRQTVAMPALPFGLTADALAAAMAEADPDSLAAATRLRSRFGPDLAAAALHQAALRRRAAAKFGADADAMFFTRAGLEQATRPEVADQHAARLVAAGARRVIDLGCGIGSDAMAFARAGLEVVAVDIDPDTAAVARGQPGAERDGDLRRCRSGRRRPGAAGRRGLRRPGPAQRARAGVAGRGLHAAAGR